MAAPASTSAVEATLPTPANEPAPVETTPQQVPQLQLEQEEPTTAQAPVWDDEPQTQLSAPVASDGWITNANEISVSKVPLEHEESTNSSTLLHSPEAAIPALPPQLQHKAETSPIVPPAKAVTPLSHGRPTSTHRISGRFKNTDQAVIMPTTNFGNTLEKIGMQFGSVSLGDDVSDSL